MAPPTRVESIIEIPAWFPVLGRSRVKHCGCVLLYSVCPCSFSTFATATDGRTIRRSRTANTALLQRPTDTCTVQYSSSTHTRPWTVYQ